MAFNGIGTFQRLYSWATDLANNIPVRADRMDAEMDGFAAGLSNCICKDGQSTPTANLGMGGYKFINMGVGAAATDSVTYGQVFSSPIFTTPYALTMPALGSNNLLLATTSYVDGTAFAAALPAQAGKTNMVPRTNGAVTTWEIPRMTYESERATRATRRYNAGL